MSPPALFPYEGDEDDTEERPWGTSRLVLFPCWLTSSSPHEVSAPDSRGTILSKQHLGQLQHLAFVFIRRRQFLGGNVTKFTL